jgi:hypothetical protein
MFVVPSTTVAVTDVGRLMVSLWMLQPALSTLVVVIVASGIGPPGGQATYGMFALPFPPVW